MCLPVVVFLSSIVLHSVSAGGLYCAKTARARAAALGLDYPGLHGAPDLSGPDHHGMQPRTKPFSPQPYHSNDPELAEAVHDIASYRQDQPRVRSLDDRVHKQAYPRSFKSTFPQSRDTYNPVQSKYNTNQVLLHPRGHSVINRKSNFEEVKRVAPPTVAAAPGQTDLVNGDPQGHNKPLSFVYNGHDLVVDESVPNRRGMSLSGHPLPHSLGHGTPQRGLTGYGLRMEAPVLSSSGFTHKDHVRAMTSRGPAVVMLKKIGFPGHLAQPLYRSLNVRQFVQGNPILRHMTELKSGPVRISQ